MELIELKPGSFIYVAHGVFAPEFCKMLMSSFDWDKERQIVGATTRGDSEYKKGTDLHVDKGNPMWGSIDMKISEGIIPVAKAYIEMHPGLQENMVRDSGYVICRYEQGVGKYDWHSDDSDPNEPLKRRAAMIAYLNDVEEGGETEFFHQKVAFKPKAGSVIIFPGSWTHRHRGLIPVSGPKYIVTTMLISALK